MICPSFFLNLLFFTAHIHWDPEYCDVKVIQTLMLLSEIKAFMEDAIQKHRPNSTLPIDCSSVPLVLCGDFNSLPDSGKSNWIFLDKKLRFFLKVLLN